MELGMIGLGRMGASMAERLVRRGHRIVGYDRNREAVRGVRDKGAAGADTIETLVATLASPRTVWLMIPAGDAVDETLQALLPHLASGDVVVDGGNSHYRDTTRRARRLGEQGVHFVDVGVSGGIWGLSEGYCLMVGGAPAVVERLRPIFEALAPAPHRGWARVGPTGAGHFVKMVHNGIEYGLMQAYAEGFAILREKAEFALDVHQIADLWRDGSVVRSWLLDLIARALAENPELSGIAPYVEDSGEGRWTVFEAIDLNVPAPVITLALYQRVRSRLEASFSDKLVAAMRHQFGGHGLKREP